MPGRFGPELSRFYVLGVCVCMCLTFSQWGTAPRVEEWV